MFRWHSKQQERKEKLVEKTCHLLNENFANGIMNTALSPRLCAAPFN